MNIRCYNRNSPDYPLYGGRGVTVCAEWRESFPQFLLDMGTRPSQTHSLDRIDSNGNYEPGNCRWATPTEQVRGRRKALHATIKGERLPLIVWAQLTGTPYPTLVARMTRMTAEEAVLMGPPKKKREVTV
jgi:hypothetical protein